MRKPATDPLHRSRIPFLRCLQPGNNSDDDYATVLGYSYLFYEAQQSGVLPNWNRLLYGTTGPYGTGFRKSAHTTENLDGINLVGGWYDAGGEHGFWVVVMVAAVVCVRH